MISKEEFGCLKIDTNYGFETKTRITCPSDIDENFRSLETIYCGKDIGCKKCWDGILKDFNWEAKHEK